VSLIGKQLKDAVRLDLNVPSTDRVYVRFRSGKGAEHVQYNLRSTPIYAAEHLPRLLAQRRSAV